MTGGGACVRRWSCEGCDVWGDVGQAGLSQPGCLLWVGRDDVDLELHSLQMQGVKNMTCVSALEI